MKIALIGYGKMGKEVERLAQLSDIQVVSIIDPKEGEDAFLEITAQALKNADVAIDFTSPAAAIYNMKKVASLKKNMVVATTGWYDQLEEAKKIVKNSGIGLIYSPNFSIGVNMYFRMVEEAAKLMDKASNYDVYSYEFHHNQKVDAPSGTAKQIAGVLIKNIARKKKPLYGNVERKIEPDELHVQSVRAGFFPGTHSVGFDSESDTIEIKHTARNRLGFAQGALLAAKWISGKKGLYTMDDFLSDYFKPRKK